MHPQPAGESPNEPKFLEDQEDSNSDLVLDDNFHQNDKKEHDVIMEEEIEESVTELASSKNTTGVL